MPKFANNQGAFVRALMVDESLLAEAAVEELTANRKMGSRVTVVEPHFFVPELYLTVTEDGVQAVYHEEELG